MLLVTKNSERNFAKSEAGGKGYNLFLMANAGFNVPEFVVLGPEIYNKFLDATNIRENLQQLLKSESNPATLSHSIHQLITNTAMPSDISEFVLQSIRKLESKLWAVRSSALDEDSAGHSFAGQLSSYLYIKTEEALINSVKECWASGYSERSIVYRRENKLPNDNVQVAVVLQEMLSPDKSGVLFTCDPISGKTDNLMINSVYGVGEGIVSGLLEPDNILMDTKTGKVLKQELACKTSKLVQDEKNQTCKEAPVERKLQEVSSLSQDELSKIFELSKKLIQFYKHPQDVEWAISNGKLYLLQSRPVTTKVSQSEGLLYIWDNSNIVESYGGLTLPLTFHFAHYVYHQVYVQFCEVLMVPQKHIKEMDFFLKNMLGLFYGRVYYNLLNWYKLTSILPGYKYNRQFMETMMGTSESLMDEIAERVKPPAFDEKLSSKFRKVFTGLKFLFFHYTIQNIVNKFLKHFYDVYENFQSRDYSMMAADDIYADYQELESKMLWKWHAPIINDYLCMVHFGLFKKLTEKWLHQLGEGFHNDLLAGNGNLESALPTKELIKMAGEVDKIPELKKIILETKNSHCLEALKQSKHILFYKKVLLYIKNYGFRCMSEMKLEQKDLHQDPSLLFVFLKNLINSGQTDLQKYELRENEIRNKAEAQLKSNMGGIKSIVYKWSLRHARKAVMNRENTRFCRTRVYGIVRSMFYGIGEDFCSRGIINKKEDIFYLTLQELKGALEGTNTILNLKQLIKVRINEYESYLDKEPAPRFHTRGPVYWQNQHFPEEQAVDATELGPNMLKGIGCSPGLVEGIVKVILSPDDDMVLNGEILVTHRTDPGWIPLYPSASALLVERGGLLSHSAVVAREMGLPAVVSVKGLTNRLKSGMKIRINGETGIIEILKDSSI
jgi:rifampicin phosphotransferase